MLACRDVQVFKHKEIIFTFNYLYDSTLKQNFSLWITRLNILYIKLNSFFGI